MAAGALLADRCLESVRSSFFPVQLADALKDIVLLYGGQVEPVSQVVCVRCGRCGNPDAGEKSKNRHAVAKSILHRIIPVLSHSYLRNRCAWRFVKTV
jgi:hypothetical protein